jgi:hypothetical protein
MLAVVVAGLGLATLPMQGHAARELANRRFRALRPRRDLAGTPMPRRAPSAGTAASVEAIFGLPCRREAAFILGADVAHVRPGTELAA